MSRLLLLSVILLFACAETNSELERQKAKVTQAQLELHNARAELQTLRDSLQTEIRRNVALGIPEEQAKSIEQARVKSQETIGIAAEKNLAAQQAYLHTLSSQRP